ncbi:MAG: hypothetical protein HYX78_07610 [Armatimonadetes bacterium]|nr:hypothetical protein [Armatimonadota bacterium]
MVRSAFELVVATALLSAGCLSSGQATPQELFPRDLPGKEWVEFRADGFSRPVSGMIYRLKDKVICGVALGGIDVGCIDLETSGLLGYSTVFNSHVPRRGPINLPILGISTGGKTWVLTTGETKQYDGGRGGSVLGMTRDWVPPLGPNLMLERVEMAKSIDYWGHYPVVDIQYQTDAPVSVALRAWSPFIPGDTRVSDTPGAVFEAHLQDTTLSNQSGTVAFSFPDFEEHKSRMDPNAPRLRKAATQHAQA